MSKTWVDVPVEDIFDEIESGAKLQMAVLPGSSFYREDTCNVSNECVGKILKLVQEEENCVRFYKEVEE